MFSPTSLEDLALLRETVELECKLAQGPNGQGEVPKDFWPTYSAMANAHGGVVLLGVREKDGVFSIAGIPNPAKVQADLFNNLNNPGKVSANLLTDADVQELVLGDKSILVVRIPQATRQQKPVFLNGQPLGHTYQAAEILPFVAPRLAPLQDNRGTPETRQTSQTCAEPTPSPRACSPCATSMTSCPQITPCA